MTLQRGTRLGPYEILDSLGAGGMGEVYRARDTRLDRAVAIKVLPSHLSESPQAQQRFEREARAVSSLNHPHVCTLHDIGHHEGTDFLVLELLDGETLADRLQRGPLPVQELLRYAIQIGDALDKAHRQGVVHRDLKPGNIMLTKSGVAKLLDFGLAKHTGGTAPAAGLTALATAGPPLTAEGSILGTFQYMAPEQLEGKEADARSDVFAFGAVLYEMATGRRAFQGKSTASVIAAILHVDPPSITTLQPLSPPALETLVSRCLVKDPEERWQSARDLVYELQSIAEAGVPSANPVASSRPGIRKERILWIAAVALLAVTAAALGLGWRGAVSTDPEVLRAFIPAPEGTTYRSFAFNAGPVAVSPDGRRLVFSARKKDGADLLWLRPIDSVVATPLVGTEGGSYPFWSPDGRSIGFFAAGKLRRIDVAGGPALSLCDASDGRGGAWSRDGVILFSSNASSGLFRIPADGGAPVQVTTLDKAQREETHRWPQFLPDGRRFIFFVRVGQAREGNVMMAGSLDGGRSKVILRTDSQSIYSSGYLLFMRQTTLMAQAFDTEDLTLEGEAVAVADQVVFDAPLSHGVFSASDRGLLVYQTGTPGGGTLLTWFDRAGRKLGVLGERAPIIYFSLSPDLKSVAVDELDLSLGPPDVWIYDVARGLRSRFTFERAADSRPIWSPDGSKVVFSSSRNGDLDLYIKSFSGSGEEQLLLAADGSQAPGSWSSDGRYLAYSTFGGPSMSDIWVLPFFGDRKPIPFLQTQFHEETPEFSPDGRWIAYTSTESGRYQVYVAPFPGPGRKWQISAGEGRFPRWRKDGRELYYLAPDNTITAVQIRLEDSAVDVGASTALFKTPPVYSTGTIYRVTPDGERFLVNTALEDPFSAPLTVVQNWSAALRKR
jgi:eukaryotic-like serine/threonine-protein kinase